ncbi:hypothetical protein [Myceligenerans cantabricum]
MAKTIWDQLADDTEFLLATLDPRWVDEQVANVRKFEDKLERSGGRLKGSRTCHPLAVNVSNYQGRAGARRSACRRVLSS